MNHIISFKSVFFFHWFFHIKISVNWTCWISSDLSGSEEEEGAAILEEREALNLQKKMAAELDDMDFGLEIFKVMGIFNSYPQLLIFFWAVSRCSFVSLVFFFQFHIYILFRKKKRSQNWRQVMAKLKRICQSFQRKKSYRWIFCINLINMYIF